jgi:CTP:molybdopterin cytidylyltransferase MocA
VVRASRRVVVDVDDPGVVRDVDTPADLEVSA